jgi:hypothetical protein
MTETKVRECPVPLQRVDRGRTTKGKPVQTLCPPGACGQGPMEWDKFALHIAHECREKIFSECSSASMLGRAVRTLCTLRPAELSAMI